MSVTTSQPREHRVAAFCDWLETLPPGMAFYGHPSFRFFENLTDHEIDRAGAEMQRRSVRLHREADKLEAELFRRVGGGK